MSSKTYSSHTNVSSQLRKACFRLWKSLRIDLFLVR